MHVTPLLRVLLAPVGAVADAPLWLLALLSGTPCARHGSLPLVLPLPCSVVATSAGQSRAGGRRKQSSALLPLPLLSTSLLSHAATFQADRRCCCCCCCCWVVGSGGVSAMSLSCGGSRPAAPPPPHAVTTQPAPCWRLLTPPQLLLPPLLMRPIALVRHATPAAVVGAPASVLSCRAQLVLLLLLLQMSGTNQRRRCIAFMRHAGSVCC
jgi:hypothetical protein